MSSSFWVEPALPEDVPFIYLLINSFVDSGLVKPWFMKEIALHHQNFWVAKECPFDDGLSKNIFNDCSVPQNIPQVVGCCALFSITESLLELRSLVVHSDCLGKGVAKWIILRMISLAKKQKKNIFCFSKRSSFFENLGFSIVQRKDIYLDPNIDERYAFDRCELELGLKIYFYKI